MNRQRSALAAALRRTLGMTLESYQESRGLVLPMVIWIGACLLVILGLGLPAPLEPAGSLAGAFSFGGLCLVLSLAAMALGAWSLAADRSSGFCGLLLAKPLSGPSYFLGRFLGLALRLTAVTLISGLVCGSALSLLAPDVTFSPVLAPEQRFEGSRPIAMEPPALLRPGGPQIGWRFKAFEEAPGPGAGLRLKFRPRYPSDKPLSPVLPLRVEIRQGSVVVLEREVKIRNRKSLNLTFPVEAGAPVQVGLSVPGGQNFLEIHSRNCTLIRGETSAVVALVRAMISFLPLLYLALGTALLFSAFVSVPTSFFAVAVLALFVAMGPSLQAELSLIASDQAAFCVHSRAGVSCSCPHPEIPVGKKSPLVRGLARGLGKGLTLLPDPRIGGSLDPLTRLESPGRADMTGPWQEGWPHLVILLILGCLVTGRRRE